jgi:hypothetical protein
MARDLNTRREKELYRGPTSITEAVLALSSDGRQLAYSFFAKQDSGKGFWTLQVIPVAGGEPRELLRLEEGELYGAETEEIRTLAWMPDGRHLLFGKGKGTITRKEATEVWRIPSNGGEPQRVGLAMDGLLRLSIHPGGRRLAFTGGASELEVWAMENLFSAAPSTRADAGRR